MEKKGDSPETFDIRLLRSCERMMVDKICPELIDDEDELIAWMRIMSTQVSGRSSLQVFVHVVAQFFDYRNDKFVSFYSRRYQELSSLIPADDLEGYMNLIGYVCTEETKSLLRAELNKSFREGFTGIIESCDTPPEKQAS